MSHQRSISSSAAATDTPGSSSEIDQLFTFVRHRNAIPESETAEAVARLRLLPDVWIPVA